MLKINVPDTPNSIVPVTLGGLSYQFKFYYISRIKNPSYYLDIYYNNQKVVTGLKMVEGVPLLKKYALLDFDHGELVVFKMKQTDEPLGRDNFGNGKAYELLYVSREELNG